MNWRPILLLLLLSGPAWADIPFAPPAPAGQLCRQAIAAAERAHHIPAHLLAAIARVERGRKDQASGTLNPWPWTINMDGAGSFYDSKALAVAAATSMRARAVRSVDVGCMQVSLTYHPDAFPNMETAFDPASNAEYGARFLAQLFEKAGSWPKAVELYHSATPELGQPYQRQVFATWPEEQRLAEAVAPPPPAGPWGPMMKRPLQAMPSRQAPHIIPLGSTPGSPSEGATLTGRTLDAYRAMPVRMPIRIL